ncbi:MAG: aldo/keto reductase family protein [Planctomycetes bacterium]|nr:aldo/keto reductase family protein [Planctomycetota bacterium]
MDTHRLGASGLKVPSLALGSWLTLPRLQSGDADEMIRHAWEAGIYFFDTADIYDEGRAEEVLAESLADLPRHQLVLATKAYFPMSDGANDRGLSRKHLTESIHASLKRLKTDYVDLFQCHRPDPETPLLETVRTMGDLIGQGKVLYWGTSMWPSNLIEEVCKICDEQGVSRPISEQPRYSLLCREIEDSVAPTCEQLGLGLLLWSPLAQGLLTGKYMFNSPPPVGSRAAAPNRLVGFLDHALTHPEVHQRVEALRLVASKAERSMAQLALGWILQKQPRSTILLGATSLKQLQENCAVLDQTWDDSLIAACEEAVAGPKLEL